ncbi:MAG: SapC family protein [Acetobacteraceae bacterium]|nr:SapC family protein [Acetobacteraceae bacterium]
MSDSPAAPSPNGAAAPTPVLPPLFRALEPLTAQRHGRLRVRDAGLGFAREATVVPLAAEEFVAAARSLPIVFAAQAPHLPVAVTGLAAGHSLYVEADGRWRAGAYVPAYLRRHPFILVRSAPNSDQLVLCIDPGAPQFSDSEGEALFDAEGKATPALDRALGFCRALEEAALRTRAMADGLAEAGLLKPAVVQFEQAGRPIRIDGFWAVDRAALGALPAERLAMLRDRGWLEAIYAHLLSIGGLSSLAQQAGPLGG